MPYGDNEQTTTIPNINITGNIVVTLNDSTSGGDRVSIDDLTWSCFSVLNTNDQIIKSFKMYPNPNNGNKLFFNLKSNVKVNIFNVLGKLVTTKELTINNNQIDISNISKGIYLVKVKSEKIIITKNIC